MSRIAIVGAGPSGFYTAEQLLEAGHAVDLLDRLPTPFGLVRAGVAPDHPKIKSVTRVYERTAGRPGFRFFGGVELGRDVDREELLEHYAAVVYAVGTALDNRLGIPGEDLPGSHPATEFVSWYNGHPDFAEHRFDLDGGRAVVVGNGNVAVDVARMLVLADEELAPTDTADHALDAFGRSAVEEVVVLGRRGPAQAAFTTPELRELAELGRADLIVEPADFSVPDDASGTVRRNVELLRDLAGREPQGRSHRIVLRFLRSPVEILGTDRVEGVRVVRNELVDGRPVPTDDTEVIPCGLVLRAVGYRGEPLPGVPFDERRGRIPTRDARVLGPDGEPLPGEYAVGWIKRGPSGVIGTNKKCASETVAAILADELPARADDPDWLPARLPDAVTWDGWRAIDAHERAAGEPTGRPRVKIVSEAGLRALAHGRPPG